MKLITYLVAGAKTDGNVVWYYLIEPDADGNVLTSWAIGGGGDCPGFEHGSGYEYMVEHFAPLAVESPDWLSAPTDAEREDIAAWRAKLQGWVCNA